MIAGPTTHVAVQRFVVLVPTLILALGLAAAAIVRHRGPVKRLILAGGDWVTVVVPRLLALATFVAGAILLFSGAVPTPRHRLGTLQEHVPWPSSSCRRTSRAPPGRD